MAIQTLLPSRLQGSGQALISMTTAGLAAFTANVVGGLVYANQGPEALFGISALFGVAGAIAGWLDVPAPGHEALRRSRRRRRRLSPSVAIGAAAATLTRRHDGIDPDRSGSTPPSPATPPRCGTR